MNNDESEQLNPILPGSVFAELDARAAKKGCKPAQLVKEALEQAATNEVTYMQEMIETTRTVDAALALHIPAPWPDRFNDCLVVGVLLGMWQKHTSETLLLEANGPKMDAIEEICRAEGISYEEFFQKALDAKLHGENPEDKDDQDEADWWKQ